MTLIRLVIRKNNADTLVFSLNQGFRLFFLGPGLFLIFMMLLEEDSTSSNLGPIIFAVVLLLSGCYYEGWVFDKKAGTITRHYGLLFLFQRKNYPLDSIESIHLDSFTKGKAAWENKSDELTGRKRIFQKKTYRFYLILNQGDRLDLEMLTERQYNQLKEKAEALATFCGKRLSLEQ